METSWGCVVEGINEDKTMTIFKDVLMTKEVYLEAVAGCFARASNAGFPSDFLKEISGKRKYLLRTPAEELNFDEIDSWFKKIKADIKEKEVATA